LSTFNVAGVAPPANAAGVGNLGPGFGFPGGPPGAGATIAAGADALLAGLSNPPSSNSPTAVNSNQPGMVAGQPAVFDPDAAARDFQQSFPPTPPTFNQAPFNAAGPGVLGGTDASGRRRTGSFPGGFASGGNIVLADGTIIPDPLSAQFNDALAL
jgi:hypothetical protein